MIDYKFLTRVVTREYRAVDAYRKTMPKKPPVNQVAHLPQPGLGRGRAEGWRLFQKLIRDHEHKCVEAVRHCSVRKAMGGFW